MKSKSKRGMMKKEPTLAGEEGLDPSSAFVHMAVKNRNSAGGGTTSPQQTPQAVSSRSLSSPTNHDFESPVPQHVVLAQGLAHEGNIMFGQRNYHEAVRLFTEAIKLDPQEVRFFGNRAFCREILGEFNGALEDADTALSIQPSWTKGLYRRGCALEGLNRLEEAERTFDHLLRLDAECPEAKKARQRVMAKQLMQLGFSVEQSEAAALHYNSVKTAAESLTATRLSSSSALSEVFDSDDEEAMLTDCWSKSSTCSSSGRSSAHVLPVNSTSPPIAEQQNVDPLLDWKNPLHWPTLWVGNLGPATTEKIISQMFTKYGKVRSMQLMLDKHCAFITFVEWKHAGDAMKDLQNREHLGQKLLIKFPDRALEQTNVGGAAKSGAHPTTQHRSEPAHSAHRGTVILRKTKK